MSRVDAVERFAELVGVPDPPLDRAALALAAGAEPELDVERWLTELDRLAEGVGSLHGLLRRLFTEEGFAGNQADYQDPRNSLLHHVLDRRLGIPITLAVVTIEVGRRAEIPLEGIGMPGHFLVHAVDAPTYLDVFHGGTVLDEAGCAARYRAATGRDAFDPSMLPVAGTHAILTRMLLNLRAIYRSRGRVVDLEWVLRMRLALPGAGPDEFVALAEVQGVQGRWHEGARLLDEKAGAAGAEDAQRMRTAARSLRAHLN